MNVSKAEWVLKHFGPKHCMVMVGRSGSPAEYTTHYEVYALHQRAGEPSLVGEVVRYSDNDYSVEVCDFRGPTMVWHPELPAWSEPGLFQLIFAHACNSIAITYCIAVLEYIANDINWIWAERTFYSAPLPDDDADNNEDVLVVDPRETGMQVVGLSWFRMPQPKDITDLDIHHPAAKADRARATRFHVNNMSGLHDNGGGYDDRESRWGLRS